MGVFHGSDATKAAVEVVKSALESGSVKLLGPNHQDDVETFAKADATYLSSLLNQIVTQLKA